MYSFVVEGEVRPRPAGLAGAGPRAGNAGIRAGLVIVVIIITTIIVIIIMMRIRGLNK